MFTKKLTIKFYEIRYYDKEKDEILKEIIPINAKKQLELIPELEKRLKKEVHPNVLLDYNLLEEKKVILTASVKDFLQICNCEDETFIDYVNSVIQ